VADRREDRLRRAYAEGLSVVVNATDATALKGCLDSLCEQTLDSARFEVIVVSDGDAEVAAVVADFPVRHLRAIGSSPFTRDAMGTAAAHYSVVAFVPGTERVDRWYLEALAEVAGPRVMAIEPGSTAGLALPTGVAQTAYRETAGLEDAGVFWATALVRGRLNRVPVQSSAKATEDQPKPLEPADLPRQARIVGALSRLIAADSAELRDGAAELRDRLTAEVQRLNAYLLTRPEDHSRVVGLLDRHRVADVPYADLNRGLARGLVIAYAFPPYGDTSAIVMAKRVREEGVVVDVVSNAMDRIREVDESLRRISGPFTAAHILISSPTYFADWGSMEQFTLQGLEALRAHRDQTQEKYAWIYSRAQFAASHFLAAVYKLDNPEIPWRAEFSDPLSRDVTHAERGNAVVEGALLNRLRDGLRRLGLPVPQSANSFVWCEELAYALADELIFTNRNQLDYMLGYCANSELAAIARAKAVIRPHPTLPADFYDMAEPLLRLDPSFVHIGYFGNFYATRGLDDVLHALATVPNAVRSKLRLHVLTSRPDELRNRAADLGLTETVHAGPYVEYLRFLALTKRFDCLLVNDAATRSSHGDNPYLPSKWSDYRGSGTPVWGLCEDGSTLSEQQLTYASPIGDVAAAAEILTRIARREPIS
jgi:poly(ribitol-phosphate) beta-N-acetylglucosaminyltransferase